MILIQTLLNNILRKAGYIRPFRHCQSTLLECEPSAPRSVPLLFLMWNPFAVTRLIIAIVIDAIKLMFKRWTRPHIGVEVFELHPAATNRDAPTAVFFISRGALSEATRSHPVPYNVFGRLTHPVSSVGRDCHFSMKTPAASGFSRSQPSSQDEGNAPAVTKAFPHGAPHNRFFDSFRGEPPELLIRKITKTIAVWMGFHVDTLITNHWHSKRSLWTYHN
jgi:hypothetical protein